MSRLSVSQGDWWRPFTGAMLHGSMAQVLGNLLVPATPVASPG